MFGAGTVQWSWGLANVNAWDDGTPSPATTPPDPNMEQATVNLFAEMGVQPGSLIAGLVTGTQVDRHHPADLHDHLARQQARRWPDGSKVTISGTATDAGGGVVAGVEVSTNNGSTWHPATLTTAGRSSVSWSYTWVATRRPRPRRSNPAPSTTAPTSRARRPGSQVNVSCPCSIWGIDHHARPTTDAGDHGSVELGVKFTSETFGTVSGIRFYKSAANTGTHVGSLWTASGTLLASATFTSETASGWQQVNFSTPCRSSRTQPMSSVTSPPTATTPPTRTTSTRRPHRAATR